MSIPKNSAFLLPFPSVTTANAKNTSVTPTVYLTKDGGTQVASTNAATHKGNGSWQVQLTAAEMNFNVIGWITDGAGLAPGGGAVVTEADYTPTRAGYLDRLALAAFTAGVQAAMDTQGYTTGRSQTIDKVDGIDYRTTYQVAILVEYLFTADGFPETYADSINFSDLYGGSERNMFYAGEFFAVKKADSFTFNRITSLDRVTGVIGIESPITVAQEDIDALGGVELYFYQIPVQAGVRDALDAQGYTDDRAEKLDFLDAPVSEAGGSGGSGGGSGGSIIRQVHRLGDFPQTASLTPWRLTEGDTDPPSLSMPLVESDGDKVLLADDAEVTFSLAVKGGAETVVIDAAPATLTAQDGFGERCAEFTFSEDYPVPAAGDYEATFYVGGQTYPLGRRQPVRVQEAI